MRYRCSIYITNSKYIPPPDDAIRTALAPFGVSPDQTVCERIRVYLGLLLQWNEKISLTAVRRPNEILSRHFGESMFAASAVPVDGGRLADVGSGAGFPGLALRLICPELHVVLIESNTKKAAFLAEVSRSLKLTDVVVLSCRFEEATIEPGSLDFIASRALTPSRELLLWARRCLSPDGKLVLWTSAEAVSLISSHTPWKWFEPMPIPQSKQRALLVGQPL